MQKLKDLKNIFKSWFPTGGSFCFYCQVDSDELKGFLILVIGGLILASVFAFIGLWLKGRFKNVEHIKEDIFKFENRK